MGVLITPTVNLVVGIHQLIRNAIKGRGAKKELICLDKDCGYSEAAGDE
mgnify:CR=1 FL=1